MSKKFFDPEFLKRIEKLSITSKQLFTGQVKGEKRSPKRGMSVEFADYRNYSTGDDLRYVDWNIYGRLERLFIKLFMEEEDLHIHILVDASQSMDFGEPKKIDYAKSVAAALGYIGLISLDRIGMGVFSAQLDNYFGPVRGKGEVFRLFEFIGNIEPNGETNLAESLKRYVQITKKPGVAILISDFLDPQGYEKGLKALLYHKFDSTVIHLLDDTELNPNLVGDLKLIDSETGEEREVTISAGILRAYKRGVDGFCQDLQNFCMGYGINYILTPTSRPFEELILKYLRRLGVVK